MALLIFFLVYLGMLLGRIPGLRLDRTAIVLLGVFFLFLFQKLHISDLTQAVDWPTLAMLLGLMIVSSQLYLSGLYSALSRKMQASSLSPARFLFFFIFTVAFLSAFLINDIICLALTPIIIEICVEKRWPPLPFLIALASSANIGSALTLMGNPQNIFLSEVLDLSFVHYFYIACIPCILSLIASWALLLRNLKKLKYELCKEQKMQTPPEKSTAQIAKGLSILCFITLFFFFAPFPRYQVALIGAFILLVSRKISWLQILRFVDWKLLALFFGLFLINHALLATSFAKNSLEFFQTHGVDLSLPLPLYLVSFLFSNLFSNVPAAMLLVGFAKTPFLGALLALATTFAGNFLLVGSISNLIVAKKAKEMQISFSFSEHFKGTLLITLVSVGLSAAWCFAIY